MSTNRLDSIETFDQFGHDHWKALGTLIGGVSSVKAALRHELKITVQIVKRLTEPTTFILPACKKPQRLSDRKDVWMSPNAKKLFGRVTQLTAMKKRSMQRCDLSVPLGDFDIVDELGGKATAVTDGVQQMETDISQLIDSSELHKDGKANLRYVFDPEDDEPDLEKRRLLCVLVAWLGSEWLVFCFPVDSDYWDAGSRVLRATAA